MTTENQTNVLESLVGEDKKFKSVEDLAKGKMEADQFIETLKEQIDVLKEEIGKLGNSADRTKTLENLMSSLTTTTKPGETKPLTQPQDSGNQSAKSLSHDDVVKIVEAREAQAVAQRNVATALAPVRKVYGDKTDEVLATKAKELGLTVEELTALAAKSPQLFLNAVGVNARDNSTRSMANHSSVNSVGSGTGVDTTVRNKAYYDNLRSTMGALKFVSDKSLQIQRHKDMKDLGDAWDD